MKGYIFYILLIGYLITQFVHCNIGESTKSDDLALFKYEHEGVTQFSSREEYDAHKLRIGWWREAKLGLFLQWGIYSVPAGSWNNGKTMGNSEWLMNYLRIPIKEYEKFAAQFNPTDFDAEAWVKLAHDSGAGYIAITAKHPEWHMGSSWRLHLSPVLLLY